MIRFRRYTLLLVSFCLFINVTLSGVLNLGYKSFSLKKSTLVQITNVKKTNILVDYDVETIAEEALQEETDSDDIQFNYIIFKSFDYSFDTYNLGSKANIFFLDKTEFYKLPLFIRYQNFRL